MLLRSPAAPPLVALVLAALAGCDGAREGPRGPVGRYALNGRFVNTLEVSAQSPVCGAPVPEAELTGHLSVYLSDKGGVSVLDEGPGCTTQAGPSGGESRYVADDAVCVMDPNGAYRRLGVTGVLFRSFVLDLAALQWSYDVELTWPSPEFPDGTAKVCGRGQAALTKLAE